LPNADNQDGYGWTIVILIGAYVILIALGTWASYRFTVWGTTESLKNFGLLETVCLTAASAIVGIFTSFVSLNRNQQAGVKLEELKSTLQIGVLTKKIGIDLRFEQQKLKAAAETTAYVKLWTSIDTAYLLLAKLESSSWKAEDKILMDQALGEGRAQLIYARSPEHRILWEKVRQRARFISEEAAKINTAQQPAVWTKEVAAFALLRSEFDEITKTEINRPPPEPEKPE
jgi:hypothetical protein